MQEVRFKRECNRGRIGQNKVRDKLWALLFPGRGKVGPNFVLKSIPRFFIISARAVSKAVISRAVPPKQSSNP